MVDNLDLTPDQRANAQEVVKVISTYVAGQVNESVERRNFRRRCQQQGETFDDFLVSWPRLAASAQKHVATRASVTRSLRALLMVT